MGRRPAQLRRGGGQRCQLDISNYRHLSDRCGDAARNGLKHGAGLVSVVAGNAGCPISPLRGFSLNDHLILYPDSKRRFLRDA